jgi:uncharacterized protein YkwD
MILIAVTVAFLGVGTFSIVARLLSDRSAPVSATTPAEAVEQTPPAQTPREPTALSQNTEGAPARRISASEMPLSGTSPAPHADVTSSPEDSSPSASEQRVFKSRRALETVDPREVVR